MKIFWAIFEINLDKEIRAESYHNLETLEEIQDWEERYIIAYYHNQEIYYTHEGYTMGRSLDKKELYPFIERYKGYIILPITYVYKKDI